MGLAGQGKKIRNVAGFKDAGTIETKPEATTEVKEETSTDTGTEVSTNAGTTPDSIIGIMKSLTEVPQPIKKKQHSVYLEEDVAKELDKFVKRNNTNKSEVINTLLRKAFNIQR